MYGLSFVPEPQANSFAVVPSQALPDVPSQTLGSFEELDSADSAELDEALSLEATLLLEVSVAEDEPSSLLEESSKTLLADDDDFDDELSSSSTGIVLVEHAPKRARQDTKTAKRIKPPSFSFFTNLT